MQDRAAITQSRRSWQVGGCGDVEVVAGTTRRRPECLRPGGGAVDVGLHTLRRDAFLAWATAIAGRIGCARRG